jgi:hypothetical protein
VTSDTYFFVTHDDKVYRKDVPSDAEHPLLYAGHKLSAYSNQIVKLTPYGRGYTVKNRYSGKRQYFTRKEMVLLSLRAELVR